MNAGVWFKDFITENAAIRVEALDTYAHETARFGRGFGKEGTPYHNLYPSQVVQLASSEVTNQARVWATKNHK